VVSSHKRTKVMGHGDMKIPPSVAHYIGCIGAVTSGVASEQA
jgi:hypothetical protein